MLLESKIPGPPQNWRNHRGPTFGWEYFQAVLASWENHTWMVEEEAPKPIEEVENVVLVEGDQSKTTKVGKMLQ